MFRKVIHAAFLILLLSLLVNVQAQDATWKDTTGDHNWFTPGNWSEFPTPAHWAKVRGGQPGPTIASKGAVARRVHVGYAEGGGLTVDREGTLVISVDDLVVGKQGGLGILNMINGSITVARDFVLAAENPGGTGIVNMTGGKIIVTRNLDIPAAGDLPKIKAEMHLDGGKITVGGDLRMFKLGTLDITAGTLIIDGNDLAPITGFINNGSITAYHGRGTVQLDYDLTNKGKTTLKGVHKLQPNPIDGGLVAPGVRELRWTLPDPCVPGEPVRVDVYFTDNWEALKSFADPASIRVVSKQTVTSVSVQAQPKKRYYWAVDTYLGGADPNNNPLWGPIFSFEADNQAPQVDAGASIVTWLQEGVRKVNLDATVTDQDAYTVKWTVVSEPNGAPAPVIPAATAEDTTVTLSATGRYVLQLEASDGEYTGSDTVTIDVYSSGCEAAKSVPGYQPLVGDLNGDCRVDGADLALLQENWLKDNSLTQVWFPLP